MSGSITQMGLSTPPEEPTTISSSVAGTGSSVASRVRRMPSLRARRNSTVIRTMASVMAIATNHARHAAGSHTRRDIAPRKMKGAR